MDKIQRAITALHRVFHRHPKVEVEINTKPIPASRPRVSKWGTYYGKTYTAFRKHAAELLADARDATDKPLAVLTELVVAKPKTTGRLWPRGDNDNFEKAVWDAVTSCPGIWKDDDQILFNTTWKRFAIKGEEPCINLTIYELEI